MRTPVRAIFPLFRSAAQAQVIATLYLGAGDATPSALAKQTGLTYAGMTRLLEPLVAGGVLTSRLTGRNRIVAANTRAPFYLQLRALVAITEGPAIIIGQHLADVDGITSAHIFGSWAARALGEPGRMPDDIDLIVVGTPNTGDVHAAAARATEVLRRDVNTIVVPDDAWSTPTDAFIAGLHDRPLITVNIPEDDGQAHRTRTWEDDLADLT